MRDGATQFTRVLICLPTQDKQIPSEQKVSHGISDHVRLDANRMTGRDQKKLRQQLGGVVCPLGESRTIVVV